jgi:hypothetical protein
MFLLVAKTLKKTHSTDNCLCHTKTHSTDNCLKKMGRLHNLKEKSGEQENFLSKQDNQE